MLGILSKIFGGNKSEKDIKTIQPLVGVINQHFSAYQSLSNDQLRAKTIEFKARIREHLSKIDTQVAELNAKAEALPFSDIGGKDVIYQEIDGLKKERDEQIEEVLETLLPEAFAVVKETARRFKENAEIVSTATELDRNLSIKKEHIRIDGQQSVYNNSWMAAGSPITWNMVHYDVQLIGGTVLHQGEDRGNGDRGRKDPGYRRCRPI